jgi:hypothetical protein
MESGAVSPEEIDTMNDEERSAKLARLASCKTMGEKAYDDMYEAHSFRDANDCYRDAKDFFYDAIGLAGDLGLAEEKESLSKRLEHIKGVFRSQFVQ